MKQVFVKNLLFLQGLNLLIKPVWLLIIDAKAQNLLGLAYGEYYLLFNFCIAFNIILDIGIQSFNNTRVAANPNFFVQHLKVFLGIKLILSLVYFSLIFWIGYSRGYAMQLLAILGTSQVLMSFLLYLRSNINGLHYFVLDSLLSVGDKLIALLLCVFFYLNFESTIYLFAWAQLLGISIVFIIALILNIKIWFNKKVNANTSTLSVFPLIRKSLPFALLFMLMGFYTRADVIMFDLLLPNASYHSGIYAQSFRYLDAFCNFAMLFSGLLLPIFSRLIAKNENIESLVNLATKILLLISIAVVVGAYFYGEKFLYKVYTFSDLEENIFSAKVFRNLMACFVPMCMVYVFGTLLTAKQDLLFMNIAALISLLVNIGLNLFLIPKYASYGASISQLITQIVFAVSCVVRCYYLFSLTWSKLVFGKFILYVIGLLGVWVVAKHIENIILSIAMFACLTILLIYLMRFFQFQNIWKILKSKEN